MWENTRYLKADGKVVASGDAFLIEKLREAVVSGGRGDFDRDVFEFIRAACAGRAVTVDDLCPETVREAA